MYDSGFQRVSYPLAAKLREMGRGETQLQNFEGQMQLDLSEAKSSLETILLQVNGTIALVQQETSSIAFDI
jgi:hypothetical protein